MVEIITNLLTIDETPIFYIIKPQGYECDRFIVFNYSTFPCYYSNDEALAEEVIYTYHVVFKNENVKENLQYCRQLQKQTYADKIMHYFDDIAQEYHVIYESLPFVVWNDEL